MKNLVLLLCVAFFATTSYGQFRVTGDVQAAGDTGWSIVNDDSGTFVPEAPLQVVGDTKQEGAIIEKTGASATVLVNRTDAAVMAFGAGVQTGFTFDETRNWELRANDRATIESRQLSIGQLIMRIRGAAGNYNVGIFRTNATERLDVNGNIRINGAIINASDKKLKKNVSKFDLGLEEVLALNPISFQYNGVADIQNGGEDRYYTGLFAQELQKIAPALVSTFEDVDENDVVRGEYLQIDETAVKYMLVNAIKDQQEMIATQAEQIAQLQEAINTIGATEIDNRTVVSLSNYDLAELGQNTPNPFNGYTNIDYVVPTNATSAQISIFGTNGQLLKTLDIEHLGKGTLEVNAQDLPSGTYSYQLIVDGRSVKTQKMVAAK